MSKKINPNTEVKIIEPRVIATAGRYGDEHEIELCALEFMRDIEIFYGRNETGEHVAMIPIKVTYKRKLIDKDDEK